MTEAIYTPLGEREKANFKILYGTTRGRVRTLFEKAFRDKNQLAITEVQFFSPSYEYLNSFIYHTVGLR